MTETSVVRRIASFLLDVRIIAVILQIVFVVLLTLAIWAIGSSVVEELSRRDIAPTFGFLDDRAGFELSDAGDYTPDDTYGDAFLVGVRNTLRVVSVGLVLTTILGVLVGICLLSRNWVVRNIARVYVEILRNTPLLVQIFVWFYIVLLSLPNIRDSIQVPPEGITPLPLRWLLDLVLIALTVWFTRRLPHDSLARMLAPIAGTLLIIAAETLNLFPTSLLRLELQPIALISVRGVALPSLVPTVHFGTWLVFLGVGVVLAVALWVVLHRQTEKTGRRYPSLLYALGVVISAGAIGWFVVGRLPSGGIVVERDGASVSIPVEQALEEGLVEPEEALYYSAAPLTVTLPQRQGLRYAGGDTLLPEYTALLLALVVYTSAFIAEIVRAGIRAVSPGQTEAARALGLSYVDSLRLVILPQALRVIIPPLGNQYLNLAKNSSLAIAISFTDVFQVTGTIINQTGQSVSGILMVMGTYLIMSLVIAGAMNVLNRRFQLVTR